MLKEDLPTIFFLIVTSSITLLCIRIEVTKYFTTATIAIGRGEATNEQTAILYNYVTYNQNFASDYLTDCRIFAM